MAAIAFADDPQLQHRVNEALKHPEQQRLFADITSYVQRLQSNIAHLNNQLQAVRHPSSSNGFAPANLPSQPAQEIVSEHPSKKRKLPVEQDANGFVGWKTGAPVLIARDVTFSVPMRKKLGLEIIGSAPGVEGGLRVMVQGSRDVEGGLGWNDVEQIIAVPVPDKAQPTTNFVAIPRATSGAEALVWTIPGKGVPKNWLYGGPTGERPVEEAYQEALEGVLDKELVKYNKHVVTPSEDEFVSNIVQSHRKGEKNWHVRAWLGSKEGYIYALPTGLLFGFKKPILFFPFSNVTSISYTSVLQRTFNLVISAHEPDPADPTTLRDKDYEFAMLDQTDFAPLDAYIKKHGLNDASLAAGRRAQSTAKSGARGAHANEDEAVDLEEESELAKAERELQDAEDEEEEDFAPGSDGESDGSGSDSDEGYEGGAGDAEDYDDDDDDDEEEET